VTTSPRRAQWVCVPAGCGRSTPLLRPPPLAPRRRARGMSPIEHLHIYVSHVWDGAGPTARWRQEGPTGAVEFCALGRFRGWQVVSQERAGLSFCVLVAISPPRRAKWGGALDRRGMRSAGPLQELVWQFALQRLVGSRSHCGYWLLASICRSRAFTMAGNMPNSVPTVLNRNQVYRRWTCDTSAINYYCAQTRLIDNWGFV
jgi:hypothetical protein